MNTAALAPPAPARRLLLPALLACYLVWGSTYLAIRFALVSFPPFFQMGTRFLARRRAAAWPGCSGAARRGLPSPTGASGATPLVIGTLMLGGGMGLTASAEQHIGSGLVAAFIAVVPMLVCGWGLLFGQRPQPAGAGRHGGGRWRACCCWCAAPASAASPVGIACIAGATLAWSLGSVLSTTRLPLAPGRGRVRQRNAVWRRGVDGGFSGAG